MERVLELFESLYREHQQVCNPATTELKPTISIIQIESELCSERLREETAEEAAVKMIVEYDEYREQANRCFEFSLFSEPVIKSNCTYDSSELSDAFWMFALSRHIALGKMRHELFIRAFRKVLAQE